MFKSRCRALLTVRRMLSMTTYNGKSLTENNQIISSQLASMNKKYVTCPIYYASGMPHIGHLHSTVIGDFYHRWFQINQQDSLLSVGTDEHGIKIVKNYQRHSFKYDDVVDFVDDISNTYREQFKKINISLNKIDGGRFIRTTEKIHYETAQLFWKKIQHKIFKSTYSGWYSYNEETFVMERDQIIKDENRYSADTLHELEHFEEETFMFDFYEYLDEIEEYVKRVVPNEAQPPLLTTLNFYRQNKSHAQLSIARPVARLPWGVPVPDEPDHVMYVWFEALISYLTAAKYNGESCEVWPPTVQVFGIDIAKFHCIFFPAMLLAAGLELPKAVIVHGHWTFNDEKMGKSKANFLTLDEMEPIVHKQMDGIRWFLLNNVSLNNTNFSNELLRTQADVLGRELGNLLNWSTHGSYNPQQAYPQCFPDFIPENDAGDYCLVDTVQSLPEEFQLLVNVGDISKALDLVTKCIMTTSEFLTDNKTNMLDRNNLRERMQADTVIHMVYESLRVCAILLQPAVPEVSYKILNRLGIPLESRMFEDADDSFCCLDGENFERVGRLLGPDQGMLYKTSSLSLREHNFDIHLVRKADEREKQILSTKTIRVDVDPIQKKTKLRRREESKRKKNRKHAEKLEIDDLD